MRIKVQGHFMKAQVNSSPLPIIFGSNIHIRIMFKKKSLSIRIIVTDKSELEEPRNGKVRAEDVIIVTKYLQESKLCVNYLIQGK